MSQMDGIANEEALVKQAMKWHHKAIAITDHNGVQAFPHVFNLVTGYNKGLKEYNFDFICLSDNVPAMMAIANDISYDEIFRYQLKNKLTENDIVIGISGSGNSKNVINAIEYARECGAFTVGITGYDGGVIKKLCDLSIHFPINDMQVTEDLHLILNHMSMRILKEEKAHENLVN